jgi:serine/threonine protein kinase
MTTATACPYLFQKKIGEGTYGEVLLAQDTNNRFPVAVKKLAKKKVDLKKLKKEEKAAQALRGCSGVVRFFEKYEDDDHFFLVFEYLRGEDLLTLLMKRGSPLPEPSAKIIFTQLTEGLRSVHEKNIVHHDIKCENIIVEPLTLKTSLIDFVLCEILGSNGDCTKKDSGSYEYLPPEKVMEVNCIYKGKEGYFSGFKADIWSLGIILYAMLFSQFPWSKMERKQFIRTTGKHPDLRFPQSVENLSKEARELLLSILQSDFEKWPSIDEILAHSWLKTKKVAGTGTLTLNRSFSK